jgi:hypothetical protein
MDDVGGALDCTCTIVDYFLTRQNETKLLIQRKLSCLYSAYRVPHFQHQLYPSLRILGNSVVTIALHSHFHHTIALGALQRQKLACVTRKNCQDWCSEKVMAPLFLASVSTSF